MQRTPALSMERIIESGTAFESDGEPLPVTDDEFEPAIYGRAARSLRFVAKQKMMSGSAAAARAVTVKEAAAPAADEVIPAVPVKALILSAAPSKGSERRSWSDMCDDDDVLDTPWCDSWFSAAGGSFDGNLDGSFDKSSDGSFGKTVNEFMLSPPAAVRQQRSECLSSSGAPRFKDLGKPPGNFENVSPPSTFSRTKPRLEGLSKPPGNFENVSPPSTFNRTCMSTEKLTCASQIGGGYQSWSTMASSQSSLDSFDAMNVISPPAVQSQAAQTPAQGMQQAAQIPQGVQSQHIGCMTQPVQSAYIPTVFGVGFGILPTSLSMSAPAVPSPQATIHPDDNIAETSSCSSVSSAFADSSLSPAATGGSAKHRFHIKSNTMGLLSSDGTAFTKTKNKGRLTIVSESKVHFNTVSRYMIQFTDGELSSADGVGLILSADNPCSNNIQKLVSVFVNRTGRICVRLQSDVSRCPARVKMLELGDWLEVVSDLQAQHLTFTVWPRDGSQASRAKISYGSILSEARGRLQGLPKSRCGYLAVVIKHLGVSVSLGS
eukprot:TRINITY_DN8129_c0_g3_i1.p1 TRINITY_DN8129_c0_g3~~TRINITY_DN8129_c0_g3_i1.p1  ORF type:complete len:548 (+),score=99.58 TRINITY_DN8129_c0_g3_i1:42-1685(+)